MYTTPIDDITIAEITEFVRQRNKESIILDYKEDWTNDLEKIIAAMANTQGGVILIGVSEEDKTGFPKDIIGVDLGRGEDQLRQRVVSKAYQGIYPPVMPEVAVCPLDQNPGHAVVLVRVAPSNQTPHAVDQRRRVYVRVDSQTIPHENLASLSELEWLWDRRRRAEEGRDALIEAAKERSAWILQQAVEAVELPLLRAWVVPHFYSGVEALTLYAVKELIRTHSIKSDLKGGRWSFPNEFVDTKRSVPSGYCTYSTHSSQAFEYDELGTSGLLFSEVKLDITEGQTGWKQLHIYLILSHIDGLLKFANLAYRQGRLLGLLQVHASLHNIQGATLYVRDRLGSEELKVLRSPNTVNNILNETINRHDLEITRPTLIKQAAKSILWSFGYSWDDEKDFENWYSESVLK